MKGSGAGRAHARLYMDTSPHDIIMRDYISDGEKLYEKRRQETPASRRGRCV